MPISLATKDFVQGGLLNDVDVEVLESQFVIYNYEGKANLSADPPLALKLHLKVVDDETEHTEYITCGSSRDFVPNEDDNGDTIEKNGTATNLRKGSNLFLFNQSLEEAGFPQAKLAEGKASNYKGMKFHLERRAAPKRTGLKDQGDDAKEKTFIACSNLISTVWDKKGKATAAPKAAAAAPKASAPAKPAPAAEPDEDMTNQAMELAGNVLAEYAEAGEVGIQKFKMNLFRTMTGVDQATKNAITALAVSDDVLGVLGWAVGGDKKDKLVLQ